MSRQLAVPAGGPPARLQQQPVRAAGTGTRGVLRSTLCTPLLSKRTIIGALTCPAENRRLVIPRVERR